jgi:hypothetical protein
MIQDSSGVFTPPSAPSRGSGLLGTHGTGSLGAEGAFSTIVVGHCAG